MNARDRELVTHGQILKGRVESVLTCNASKTADASFRDSALHISFRGHQARRLLQAGTESSSSGFSAFLILSALTVLDEAFFNRRNVFVLDQNAIDESLSPPGSRSTECTNSRKLLATIEDDWRKIHHPRRRSFSNPKLPSLFLIHDAARRSAEAKQAEERQRRIEAEKKPFDLRNCSVSKKSTTNGTD